MHTIWKIRTIHGQKRAPFQSMMKTLLTTALMSAALTIPLTLAPVQLTAADRRYHDKGHNDDHEWNSHEDKAYRMWTKENHRRYTPFDKLREEDRETYWGWRHNHSDADLRINIR